MPAQTALLTDNSEPENVEEVDQSWWSKLKGVAQTVYDRVSGVDREPEKKAPLFDGANVDDYFMELEEVPYVYRHDPAAVKTWRAWKREQLQKEHVEKEKKKAEEIKRIEAETREKAREHWRKVDEGLENQKKLHQIKMPDNVPMVNVSKTANHTLLRDLKNAELNKTPTLLELRAELDAVQEAYQKFIRTDKIHEFAEQYAKQNMLDVHGRNFAYEVAEKIAHGMYSMGLGVGATTRKVAQYFRNSYAAEMFHKYGHIPFEKYGELINYPFENYLLPLIVDIGNYLYEFPKEAYQNHLPNLLGFFRNNSYSWSDFKKEMSELLRYKGINHIPHEEMNKRELRDFNKAMKNHYKRVTLLNLLFSNIHLPFNRNAVVGNMNDFTKSVYNMLGTVFPNAMTLEKVLAEFAPRNYQKHVKQQHKHIPWFMFWFPFKRHFDKVMQLSGGRFQDIWRIPEYYVTTANLMRRGRGNNQISDHWNNFNNGVGKLTAHSAMMLKYIHSMYTQKKDYKKILNDLRDYFWREKPKIIKPPQASNQPRKRKIRISIPNNTGYKVYNALGGGGGFTGGWVWNKKYKKKKSRRYRKRF